MDDEKPTTKLTAKGVASIGNAAKQRRDKNLQCSVGQNVHNRCREDYVHPKRIAASLRKFQEKARSESPTLRSKEPPFNFRSDCLFCGCTVRDR